MVVIKYAGIALLAIVLGVVVIKLLVKFSDWMFTTFKAYVIVTPICLWLINFCNSNISICNEHMVMTVIVILCFEYLICHFVLNEAFNNFYMRVRRIIPSIRKEEDRLIIHAYNDGNISFDSPEEEELFLKEMGIRKRE